jgi:hypothetical protein
LSHRDSLFTITTNATANAATTTSTNTTTNTTNAIAIATSAATNDEDDIISCSRHNVSLKENA